MCSAARENNAHLSPGTTRKEMFHKTRFGKNMLCFRLWLIHLLSVMTTHTYTTHTHTHRHTQITRRSIDLQTSRPRGRDVCCVVAGDPCSEGRHDCHELANCVPGGPTGYRCECKVGYQGNGYSCEGVYDLRPRWRLSLLQTKQNRPKGMIDNFRESPKRLFVFDSLPDSVLLLKAQLLIVSCRRR